MRRRLLVGKAMVHMPPVLVLDEPTAGVDIELRQQLWAYVKELNKVGVTIVLTTHYLEEAEELCDEIAIINKGNVIAHEDKRSLLRRIDHKTLILTVKNALNAPSIDKKFHFFLLQKSHIPYPIGKEIASKSITEPTNVPSFGD